jgi:hypothetical protein
MRTEPSTEKTFVHNLDCGDGTPGTPERRPTVVSFVGRPFNRTQGTSPDSRQTHGACGMR